ncbi:MAG: RNA methyltransferase [Candidatus Eremiobacteraeota bacterium]|nr:RNA methyltransferase [Candidatus Eremiobacteraeota bacterium]
MNAQTLGTHNRRLTDARKLLKSRERRAQGRFLLEGSTLLEEAVECALQLEAIFATPDAFQKFELLRRLDRAGNPPLYVVDERSLRSLSDVRTPPGIIAVGRTQLQPVNALFDGPGPLLVLADLSDAGNAGTLVRAADAFGISSVLFGSAGVEPFHPKVVRAAAGSLFRARVAVGEPEDLQDAATEGSWTAFGLSREGEPLRAEQFGNRAAIVVGNERHGLGRWAPGCSKTVAIPTPGHAESLNAAVAGAIALYEASQAKNKRSKLVKTV